MSAVLKARMTRDVDHRRALPSLAAPATQAPEPLPGRWLSDAELAAVANEAFDEGLRNGHQQGEQRARESARRQAEQDTKRALEQALAEHAAKARGVRAQEWRDLATALASQMQSMRTTLEAEVTEWTFIAVTRLLGSASEEQLRSAIRQVLDEARLRQPVQVLVHADDLALLSAGTQAWAGEVSFVVDPAVSLGGCLLRSAHETVDARLEVQLGFLREALDAARRDRRELATDA